MQARVLAKKDLRSFLLILKGKGELIAPVESDMLRFSVVDDVSKVKLDGHPLFSLKKYFHRPKRVMMTFRDESMGPGDAPDAKRIIFGARLCDINALVRSDMLFLDEFEDEEYKKARDNTIIIGINCETVPKPDHCFCESQELEDKGYDLFFCDAGDDFHIKVGSKKGEELVKHLPASNHEAKPIKTKKKLLKSDVSAFFDRPEWSEEAKKCISCGSCTNLCATCMCYDVFDDPNLDLKSGSRKMEWDSCQYRDFTQVAGHHVFRPGRDARLKHRVFHKLKYFKDRFGVPMCTGCGRCIEGCPTKIDFVETLNKM